MIQASLPKKVNHGMVMLGLLVVSHSKFNNQFVYDYITKNNFFAMCKDYVLINEIHSSTTNPTKVASL